MDKKHIVALEQVRTELSKYIETNATGSGGRGIWPRIDAGHPLHSAVVALECFYPANASGIRMLPDQGWVNWCKLLDKSRETGITAPWPKPSTIEDAEAREAASTNASGYAAMDFHRWLTSELAPVADKLTGQQLRIGGKTFDLSKTEAAIVQALMDAGGCVELHALSMKVWREPYQQADRGKLDAAISRLRAKLVETQWNFRISGDLLIKEIA